MTSTCFWVRRRCFNSRLPCGSRPLPNHPDYDQNRVSTHGSLAGADDKLSMALSEQTVSTHGSLAGADYTPWFWTAIEQSVSTHGSLAGADLDSDSHTSCTVVLFQLTAPLREPTSSTITDEHYACAVSTHGSLAGADSKNSHFQETFHKKKNAFSCFSNFFITFFYNIRFDLKK